MESNLGKSLCRFLDGENVTFGRKVGNVTSKLGIKKSTGHGLNHLKEVVFSSKFVGLSQGQRLKLSRAALLVRTYPTLQGHTWRRRRGVLDNWKKHGKKHSTSFQFGCLVVWGLFLQTSPQLLSKFLRKKGCMFCFQIVGKLPTPLFFQNRKFIVQQLHGFFCSSCATQGSPLQFTQRCD